jgi:hypothetical protein
MAETPCSARAVEVAIVATRLATDPATFTALPAIAVTPAPTRFAPAVAIPRRLFDLIDR